MKLMSITLWLALLASASAQGYTRIVVLAGDELKEIKSGVDGRFRVGGVYFGTYCLLVSAVGFDQLQIKVRLMPFAGVLQPKMVVAA